MFNLPESMANRFKLYLKILPEGEAALMWIGFIIAGPLLAVAMVLKCKRSDNHHKSKRNVIIWDDNSAYAKSLRKMSLDIEKSKMQSVYTPCEQPINEHNDSDSPFLNSSDKNSSESEPETEIDAPSERRSSLLKSHADKIKDMSINLGNRFQENIKHFTNKLSGERSRSSLSEVSSGLNVDPYRSSEEDNYCGTRRCSVPVDILGSVNYQIIESSDDDDTCNVEIVDDGSEFDPPTEEIIRRMSLEPSNNIIRMNKLESNSNV